LYDRLILIPHLRNAIVLTIKSVDMNTFSPPMYTWERIEALEHRLYQGYYSVQQDTRLDRIDARYGQMRWVDNAIKWFNLFNACPLFDGIYLCYVRYVWRADGPYVLVDIENRLMVPHVKVMSDIIQKEDWLWVQKIRWSQTNNRKVFEATDQAPASTEISKCSNFQQKMHRAIEEMKALLGLSSLGNLYDLQLVPMDQLNKVIGIAFVEQTSDVEPLNEKFIYRRLVQFEQTHLSAFCPMAYNKFKMGTSEFKVNYRAFPQSTYTQDEIARFQITDSDAGRDVATRKVWSLMNWVSRVIHWDMKGAESISHNLVDESTLDTDINVKGAKTGLNIFLRNKILSEAGGPWEQIVHVVALAEKKKTRKKRIDHHRHTVIVRTRSDVHGATVTENYNDYEVNLDNVKPIEEVGDIDFDAPPKIYTIELSLQDYLKKVDVVIVPSLTEVCTNLTEMMIEMAMGESHERFNYEQAENLLEELIPIIELIEELKNVIEIGVRKDLTSEELIVFREQHQKQLLTWFGEVISHDNDEEQNQTPIVYGLNAEISYDELVRATVAQFQENIDRADALLNVTIGVQESIELMYLMQEYGDTLAKVETLTNKTLQDEFSVEELGVNDLTDLLVTAIQDPVDQDMIIHAIHILDETPKKLETSMTTVVANKSPPKERIPLAEIMNEEVYPTLTLVSQESAIYEIEVVKGRNDERCKNFLRKASLGMLPLMYHSSVVRVVADYLSTKNFAEFIARTIDAWRQGYVDVKKLMACAREYSVALLYYILVPLHQTSSHGIMLQLAKVPFILDCDIREWITWESYGIDTEKLWFLRYVEDFDAEATYLSSKKWKRKYIESRVENFFTDPEGFKKKFCVGKQNKKVIQEEILLWKKSLGKHVRKLDLTRCAVTEKDLQVIGLTCTDLKELLLAGASSSIPDQVWKDLLINCKKLKKVRISNIRISDKTDERFRRCVPDVVIY
jgi:hypothetical protein